MSASGGGVRDIYLTGELGQRQLREVLVSIFVGLSIAPQTQPIWICSPWISDFQILDDPSLPLKHVSNQWTKPTVSFSDAIAAVANHCGAKFKIVVRGDTDTEKFSNQQFLNQLRAKLLEPELVEVAVFDSLHIKGLVTSALMLEGSMNFTFSGTNKNDEKVSLVADLKRVSRARLEVEDRYLNLMMPL